MNVTYCTSIVICVWYLIQRVNFTLNECYVEYTARELRSLAIKFLLNPTPVYQSLLMSEYTENYYYTRNRIKTVNC